MDNITQTYVINLADATIRMKEISDNLANNNIPFIRWEATKGSEMTREEINTTTSFMCRHFLCTYGMIGCYTSHLRLWQHIVETFVATPDPANKWFIVLEDDAYIAPGFHDNLANVFSDLRQWPIEKHRYPEVIHLACMNTCSQIPITKHVYYLHVFPTTRAYAISLRGAQKLIKSISIINFHIDITLSYSNALNNTIAFYSTKPFVMNNDNYDSAIGSLTFPQSFVVLIINPMIRLFGVQTSNISIMFQSPVLSIKRTIGVNITVVLLILIIAILAHMKLYHILLIIIMFEFTIYSFLWARRFIHK